MVSVPFASTAWDEIVPGLSMGGHYLRNTDGDIDQVVVADEFDLVISLFQRPGHGPADGVKHHVAAFNDDHTLPPGQAIERTVRDLADLVVEHLDGGRTALVRCQAGYNRSGLVVAFALLRMGWTAARAIDEIRARRSPYALCNDQFVRLIDTEAARLSRTHIEAFS